MSKVTPSMARNKIKRCLHTILDPHPSEAEVAELWQHFDSSCAYCGASLDRTARTAHVDHAISTASGGTNGIHNCVLSCARCNGDEKREEPWESFLTRKVSDSTLRGRRRDRIQKWLAQAPVHPVLDDPELRAKADAIINEAVDSFGAAVDKLQKLRAGDS